MRPSSFEKVRAALQAASASAPATVTATTLLKAPRGSKPPPLVVSAKLG